MAESMFPDATPMHSSFLVQNGSFKHVEKLLLSHLLRHDNIEGNLTFKEKQRLQRSDVIVKSTQILSLIINTQVLSRRRIWMTLSGLYK